MIPSNLRKIENLHIGIWLLKDLSWVSQYKFFGMFMIFPTIVIAILLTWKMRKEFSELAHNLAVCCWILANSIWMTGEFFYEDKTRNLASCLFCLGIFFILVSYGKDLILFLKNKKVKE
jgi:hypothetical protein